MDDNKKLPDSYWEAFLFTLPKAQPCSYKSLPVFFSPMAKIRIAISVIDLSSPPIGRRKGY